MISLNLSPLEEGDKRKRWTYFSCIPGWALSRGIVADFMRETGCGYADANAVLDCIGKIMLNRMLAGEVVQLPWSCATYLTTTKANTGPFKNTTMLVSRSRSPITNAHITRLRKADPDVIVPTPSEFRSKGPYREQYQRAVDKYKAHLVACRTKRIKPNVSYIQSKKFAEWLEAYWQHREMTYAKIRASIDRNREQRRKRRAASGKGRYAR